MKTMRKQKMCIIGLFFLFTCCFASIPASAQNGELTVSCPANSSWDGTQCKCSPGYGSRDGSSCRPLAELTECPPNSSWNGTECKCSPGYGSKDGSSCRPLAELTECPPNSHAEGSDCFCNDGFGNINGKCVSLSAACATFNARWSPAKGDCECASGYHEDTAANKCVPDVSPQQTADKTPSKGQSGKPEDSLAEQRSTGTPISEATPSSNGQKTGGDLSVRIRPPGAPDQVYQQTEVIDASSERTGDMKIAVSVGGKTVFMTEAGAEAYQRRAGAKDIQVNGVIKKDANIADVFLQKSAEKSLTKEQADQAPVPPWPGQQAQQQVNRPEGAVPTGASGKGKERAPSGGTVSSNWWTDTAQKPVAATQEKQPAANQAGIAGKSSTEKKQDLPPAAESRQRADVQIQAETAKKTEDKVLIPLQPFDVPNVPGTDVYRGISTTDSPILVKTIADSLQMASPGKKREAEEQLMTLGNFGNADTTEVSLGGKGIIEVAAEKYVDREYLKQLQQWHVEVKEATETGKVKKGIDKEKYLARAENEKELKGKIASYEEMLRMNHLRLVEASGAMKFEHMGSDYMRFWGNRSAANDFDATSEGMESNKAFTNIRAYTQQLREFKQDFKKSYPRGWQNEYLDLPEKPGIETIQKKVDDNIFVIFEKGMSK